VWIEGQDPGEGHALGFSAGKFLRSAVDERVAKLQPVEEFRKRSRGVEPRHDKAQRLELTTQRQPGDERCRRFLVELLVAPAHRADGIRAADDVLAGPLHAPCRWPPESKQDVAERRLPAAARAIDPEDRAARQVQV
jgi:hypothetical protein